MPYGYRISQRGSSFVTRTRIQISIFAGALLSFGAASLAQSQTIDICTEVGQTVNHPAEYVAEKVRKGCSVIAPHCCGPSWPSHPECYVTNNKKVRDGWGEFVSKLQCKRESLETGLNEF